jgi:alpha-tubulin suppressor-like RCC1 family protein
MSYLTGAENVLVKLSSSNTSVRTFSIGFTNKYKGQKVATLESASSNCTVAVDISIEVYQEGGFDASQFGSGTTSETQQLYVKTSRSAL